MKIVHVIETLAAEGGGGDRACAELAEAQAKLGHDVVIICGKHPNRSMMLTPDGVRVVLIESSSLLSRKLGWNKKLYEGLDDELTGAAVLHCHGAWRFTQVYALWLSRKNNIPYVYQPHGSYMPVRLLNRKWSKLIWGYLFERRNLIGAAAVHAETELDKADISLYQKHPNIYVLPCGSNFGSGLALQEEFADHFPQLHKKQYFLYMGRLDFQKGVDLLINVFQKLYSSDEKRFLAIIGPDYNDTKSQLIKLIGKENSDRIIFHSGVYDDQLKKHLYENATCFILPSLGENFGIAVLEALRSRCPVLVSKNTAWWNLEDNGGGIVFDSTEVDLERAITKFMNLSSGDREKMADYGYAVAQNYNWDIIAKKQDEIYRSLISDFM